MEHLYRIQRISTKFYEFRQVYDADIYDTSFPNYIRVLNFGRRKTGWLTYNPKKVFVDNLGNIQKIKEIWTHKQPQRQSLIERYMLPTYINIREVKIYCDLMIYGSIKRIHTLKSSFLSIVL